jgi:hypothetical protein
VSLLRSASGSGKESGHGTEHGATSSEAGEWLRYDFNSGVKRVCVFFLSVVTM